jgi:DNA-binding response OmpR family regulator
MKKVFIVDDSPEFIFLIKSLFKLKGVDLDSEMEPEKIWDKVKSKTYDLLIFDLLLPQTTGLELIERLREIDRYKETPLILLTAKKLEIEELQQVKKNGVLFLQKPIQPGEFYNKVSGLLKG